jgi:hypothetical protein
MKAVDRRRLALLVLPLALATAHVLRAQGPDPKSLGFPAVGAPPALKVLSTGAEPKAALRYAVPKDYKSGMDMTMEMGITMTMDGTMLPIPAMPSMKIGANIAVTDVSPAGDITYKVNFTGMQTVIPKDMDPALGAQLAQAFQGLDSDYKTISGVATVNPRGINQSVKFDFSKVTNPQMQQLLSSAANSLENLSLPLPEEAVGLGARWEVKQTISLNNMQTLQRTEYELVAIDGKTVTLNTKLEQSGMPQAVTSPDLPPGMQMTLKNLAGTGAGTIVLKLDALVPKSDATATSAATMEVDMGGTKMSMTTETKVKIAIVPIK